VWCCLCDPTFSRFSRTPTCDRQTDTDTGPWLVPRMHSIARQKRNRQTDGRTSGRCFTLSTTDAASVVRVACIYRRWRWRCASCRSRSTWCPCRCGRRTRPCRSVTAAWPMTTAAAGPVDSRGPTTRAPPPRRGAGGGRPACCPPCNLRRAPAACMRFHHPLALSLQA